jgi:hypothetical protein
MKPIQKNLSIRLLGFGLLAAIAACQSAETKSPNTNEDTASKVQTDTIVPALPLDSVLIPGEGAGAIKIGADAAGVYSSLGKPDGGDAAMQKAVAIWYKNHDPKSYATAIYTVRDTGTNPSARIKQIRSTDPGYRTGENLGVSSMLTEIRKFYDVHKLEGYPSDKNTALYDDTKGIAFEVDASGHCTAVLLHPKGETIKTTYLPLR